MRFPSSRRRLVDAALLSRLGHLCAVTSLVALSSCSFSGDGDQAADPRQARAELERDADKGTSYGTRVLVGAAGSRVVMQFRPIKSVKGTAAQPRIAPGARHVAGVDESPGMTALDGPPAGPSDPAVTTAWILVAGAAAECGVGAGTEVNPHVGGAAPVVPTFRTQPSGERAWSLFPAEPTSCDALLAMEEALLCTADKLVEAADTLVPITWNRAAVIGDAYGLPAGPWTIPPQRPDDRFVLKDLALHLLANVAVTDLVPVGPDGVTCSQRYADAAADPLVASRDPARLFGVAAGEVPSYFPPGEAVSPESISRLASARLALETHLLRASSRLLQDTVNATIATDLAVARSNAAHAADPVRGNVLAWGADLPAGSSGYNTVSHAVRVATGRLEIGLGTPDPACKGILAAEVLQKAYGDELSARYGDAPIATSGQAKAVAIVEASGVVIPPRAMEGAGMIVVRAAVVDELIRAKAKLQGAQPDDEEFLAVGGGGYLAAKSLAEVADEDLRFALQRSFNVYRLRTGTGAEQETIVPMSGLVTHTSPKVDELGGTVVDGGNPCPPVHPTAANWKKMAASAACPELDTAGGSINPDIAYNASFQDVFSLGQTFYRRLVVLREDATRAGLTGPDGPVELAAQAASESRHGQGPSGSQSVRNPQVMAPLEP